LSHGYGYTSNSKYRRTLAAVVDGLQQKYCEATYDRSVTLNKRSWDAAVKMDVWTREAVSNRTPMALRGKQIVEQRLVSSASRVPPRAASPAT
jgi:hypothetical protein